mmetsp:Transcript_4863/g.5481  ORF Transcript_4863/g.5481 Transcript_4863/m.5481 type:complete len:850 (+) Transcript_4863:369-2918(+)
MDTDDIFESLGGSLMKDLMADLNFGDNGSTLDNGSNHDRNKNQSNGFANLLNGGGGFDSAITASGDDILADLNLDSLEKDLDLALGSSAGLALVSSSLGSNSNTSMLAPPTGASLVVNHQTNISHAPSTLNNQQPLSAEDAWIKSLAQLESSNTAAVQDFLSADAQMKQSKNSVTATGVVIDANANGDDSLLNSSLMQNLDNLTLDDYDVSKEPTFLSTIDRSGGSGTVSPTRNANLNLALNQTTSANMALPSLSMPLMSPPPAASVQPTILPNTPLSSKALNSDQHPPPPFTPVQLPPLMPQQGHTTIHQPIPMVMTPNGPMPIPPHMYQQMMAATAVGQGGRPPPPLQQQQQMLPPFQGQGNGGGGSFPHMMNLQGVLPPGIGVHPQQHQTNHQFDLRDPVETKSPFKKKDFPILGSETKAEDGEEPMNPAQQSINRPPPPSRPQLLFNNPLRNAPPIPAKAIASSLMPPRDVTYVVNSMLRPLLSIDRYNDDFYFHQYCEKRTSMGYGNPGVPSPILKETKEKAHLKELNFRNVVVSRAKDWKEEKQVLGQIVKTDVKRPRALLSTPVLKAQDDDDENSNNGNNNNSTNMQSEEEKVRAYMRKARKLVDRGFISLLDLCEYQRLLRATLPENRRIDLLADVQERIKSLQESVGISITNAEKKTEQKSNNDKDAIKEQVITINRDVLASTLSFSKGKEMLARSLEMGLLPHRSACKLLPHVLAILLSNVRPSNVCDTFIAKEDRLLRSLSGLVKLNQPSLHASDFVQCLDCVLGVYRINNSSSSETDISPLKKVLSVVSRAEVMHTILARGGDVCGRNDVSNGTPNVSNDLGNVWKQLEREFLKLLS